MRTVVVVTALIRGVVAVLLGLFLTACGEDQQKAATTFCSDGAVACKGNYIATCNGGTSYDLAFCGEQKYCQAGTCQPTKCQKGQRSCDGKDVLECPANGDADPAKVATCGKAETCTDGVCKPATCKDGEVKCGATTAFVCASGVWQTTTCSGSQVCSVEQKGCVTRVCTPQTMRCKSDTVAEVCLGSGLGYAAQSCSGMCQGGLCVPKLATSSSKDAGSTTDAPIGNSDGINTGTGDTLIKPPKDIDLEAPDSFTVTFSLTKTPGPEAKTLDMTFASASYLVNLKSVQISGDDTSLNKIELQLAPLDEYYTGDITTAGGEGPDTQILMNDATFVPTQEAQWLYGAEEYEVYIEEFGDVGGRIKGTFSATLVSSVDGSKAYLLDGKFDVARK